jgi:hypothetical protein
MCGKNITASVVPEEKRLDFLPQYMGAHFLSGESLVYDWASRLSRGAYSGGLWTFFELSNGGFYMAPADAARMRVLNLMNGYDGFMGPDAFGITVTLFALCHLAERTQEDQIIEHYHALRDFAASHVEAAQIYRAID